MKKFSIWFVGSNGDILDVYTDQFVNRESAAFFAEAQVALTSEYKTFVLKEVFDTSAEI